MTDIGVGSGGSLLKNKRVKAAVNNDVSGLAVTHADSGDLFTNAARHGLNPPVTFCPPKLNSI